MLNLVDNSPIICVACDTLLEVKFIQAFSNIIHNFFMSPPMMAVFSFLVMIFRFSIISLSFAP